MKIRTINERFDDASRFFAIVAGWALLGLSVFIGIDVISRKLFNYSLQGSDEVGGYIMAATCAFGFSYTLAKRGHIRLNLILPHLPTKLQGAANILAYGALILYTYMLLWGGVSLFLESWKLQAVAPTPLETPLWIPQLFLALGLIWFALHLTVYGLEIAGMAAGGKFKELNRVFGVETVKEESAREIEEALREQQERQKMLAGREQGR